VQQGKHYLCDGRDLIEPTQEQYRMYKDGSHGGKKKLKDNERAEAERKLAEVRTKAEEKAKRVNGANTSRSVDVGELMRRREMQVEVQKEGKAEAKKRRNYKRRKGQLLRKRYRWKNSRKLKRRRKRRLRKNGRIIKGWQKRRERDKIRPNLRKV